MSRYKWNKTTHQLELISGLGDVKEFHGTNAEWENLTQAQKDEYDMLDIFDDFNGMPIDSTPTQNSGNPISSGGVYTSEAAIKTDIQALTNKIGNGTPTTTDKTIIGAINELNAGKVSKFRILETSAGDGVKTYKDMLDELAGLIKSLSDYTDISDSALLVQKTSDIVKNIYNLNASVLTVGGYYNQLKFGTLSPSRTHITTVTMCIALAGGVTSFLVEGKIDSNGATFTNGSTAIFPSGDKLVLYY